MDKNLKVSLLPTMLFVKNFIDGETDCNYEKYIVEFLNNSNWFRSKVENKKFFWRKNQDQGECDAFAGKYELDFKLLVSSTACQARRELSDGISVLPQGGYIIFSSRRSGTMKATRIYAAIRNLSIEELARYENGKYAYGSVEHDIQDLISIIYKKKNILFFFPYEFSSDKSNELEYMINAIREALENDFISLFQLRSKKCPDFETYISCISMNHFLFFQFNKDKLNYIDCVNTNKSKTYEKLWWYYI